MMQRSRVHSVAIGVLMAFCAAQLASARPIAWHSTASTSTPTISQVLPQVLRDLAANATLQASITSVPPDEDAITATAQHLYASQSSSAAGSASAPTASSVIALVSTEVSMPQDTAAVFQQYVKEEVTSHAAPRVAFVQSLQVSGCMYSYSVAATLRDGDSSWMVWSQSFAGLVGTSKLQSLCLAMMDDAQLAHNIPGLRIRHNVNKDQIAGDVMNLSSVWVCDASTDACTVTGARSQALDAFMLLFVHSIGVTEHIPVSVPSSAYKRLPEAASRSGVLGAISAATIQTFNDAISSMVGAFGQIMSMFGHHSTSTIIAKDTCLGFDTFKSQVQLNTFQCLDDSVASQFVSSYFGPIVSWAFPDPQQAFAELLAWEYCHASNWTADAMELTNTGTSVVQVAHVFKNHDDEHSCSNWVIATFQGQFTLAPDLIVWLKTSSSFGGFSSSMDEYIQQVPHTITLADVQAIQEFIEVLTYGQLAEMQGLPYTWPAIPNCS